MDKDSVAFLRRLLDTPGPSGFEMAPARVWRAEADGFAASVTVDVSGNSLASINPDGTPRVMLTGHIDEIGLMIVHIDDDGFLYFAPIGGWDSQVMVGQRVLIQSKDGPVPGAIGKAPIHLMKQDDRTKVSKPSDLWIDIGARSKKEALERVRIGDPAVLDAVTTEFPQNRLVSRSIDNRIGAFVVLEALRLLSKEPPKCSAFAVATTREEIGYTGGGARPGAASLNPNVAVVVDVTHATDYPGADKKEAGDCRLGGGPVLSRGSNVNPAVFETLAQAAEAEDIPYTISAAPRDTGTDVDSIHSALYGVATGLVSVPNRYMHSPNEMIDLGDLEATARLLAAFTRLVDGEADFIPR